MTVKVPSGPSVDQCLCAALGERRTHWKRSSGTGPPHISSADMLLFFLCFYGHCPLLLGDASIIHCESVLSSGCYWCHQLDQKHNSELTKNI